MNHRELLIIIYYGYDILNYAWSFENEIMVPQSFYPYWVLIGWWERHRVGTNLKLSYSITHWNKIRVRRTRISYLWKYSCRIQTLDVDKDIRVNQDPHERDLRTHWFIKVAFWNIVYQKKHFYWKYENSVLIKIISATWRNTVGPTIKCWIRID